MDRSRVPQYEIAGVRSQEVEAARLAQQRVAIGHDQKVALEVRRRVAAAKGLVALVRTGDDAEAARVLVGRRELHQALHADAPRAVGARGILVAVPPAALRAPLGVAGRPRAEGRAAVKGAHEVLRLPDLGEGGVDAWEGP